MSYECIRIQQTYRTHIHLVTTGKQGLSLFLVPLSCKRGSSNWVIEFTVHSSLFLRSNTRCVLMLYHRPGSLTKSKCWADLFAKVGGSDPSGTLSEETEGRTQSEMRGYLDNLEVGGGVLKKRRRSVYRKVQKTVKTNWKTCK